MFVHECGHFVTMLLCSVEVQELSLGMGPLIYQFKIHDIAFSLKLIPLMAYVMPSKLGADAMEKLPLIFQLLIDLSGVAVNLLIGALIFLWFRARKPITSLSEHCLTLPLNLALIFKDLFLETVSLGFIKPANTGALKIYKEERQTNLGLVLYLNILLGVLNLLPISLLDGGNVFKALLIRLLVSLNFSNIQLISILTTFNEITFVMLVVLMFKSIDTKFFTIEEPATENKEETKNPIPHP